MNRREIRIQAFRPQQADEVSVLITTVFDEFVGIEYSHEGNATLKNYSAPEAIRERFAAGNLVYVAQAESKLVGAIEIRDLSHISLLFVLKEFHQNGIARRLLKTARAECTVRNPHLSSFSVNASPYSKVIYRRLGFTESASLTEKDGIKYIPMRMDIS